MPFSNERFKEARKIMGFTQQSFADTMGVHVQSVRAWEKTAIPKPEALVRMSELLEVSEGYLRGEPVDDTAIEQTEDFFRQFRIWMANRLGVPIEKLAVSISVAP